MARLNIERQRELEPERMNHAKKKLMALGFDVTEVGTTELQFTFKGKIVRFYPYSGWATGASIKDGRGLKNLLNQISNGRK